MLLLSIFMLAVTNGAMNIINRSEAYAADESVAEYPISADNSCIINSSDDFVAYSKAYKAYPDRYQNVDISIAITTGNNLSDLTGFVSIGTAEYPFAASLKAGGTNLSIALDTALFDYVLDSAKIQNLGGADIPITFSVSGSTYSSLFAENVVHDAVNTPASWKINIDAYKDSNDIQQANTFAGVIGVIGEGAQVDLIINNNAVTDAGKFSDIISADSVGFVCRIMKSGSKLTVGVAGTSTGYNITSEGANAGGIVGKAESASITVKSAPGTTGKITSAQGYAGGIIGYATDTELIIESPSESTVAATLSGTLGTGGIFGYYKNTSNARNFDLAAFNINCTLNGENSGGVFGVLENGGSITVSDSGTNTVILNRTSEQSSIYGGIIGSYLSDDKSNSLAVSGITVNCAKDAGSAEYYGGIIGKVDDDSYISIDGAGVTATLCNTNVTAFGGVVGYIGNAYIEAKNITVNTNGSFIGGGIAGVIDSGVLCLGGTSDLSATTAGGGGQIVGTRGNQALIYAENGWKLIRGGAATYDDVGTWGEVLRFSDTMPQSEVLTIDSTSHTVTVKAAVTAVGSISDFARLALNIQLNDGADAGLLNFEDKTNKSSVLLGTDITLSSDINLSGTGITGLTRDDGKNVSGTFDITTYSGTFDGGNNTLTVATGEPYGYRGNINTPITADDTSDGNGTIYRHAYSGLFAKTGADTVIKNLSITGGMYTCMVGETTYVGGICAQHISGAVTFSNVNISQTMKADGKNAGGKYTDTGGLIGVVAEAANPVITIENSTISPTVTSDVQIASSNVQNIGGAIGGIYKSDTFTVNCDNVTLGSKLSLNSQTEGKMGGFISYIFERRNGGSTALRTITFKNVTIDGASITCTSTNRCGGLLGDIWKDTKVIIGEKQGDNGINGITVTDSSVTQNGNANPGGLIYAATGYWQVNKIAIDSLALSGKNASSFGMLVNNGINDGKALYLELTAADSYTVNKANTTVDIGSNTVFDELVATCTGNYSNSVEDSNRAVVSIHTSGDKLIMNGTECNTYQNQTSLTKVNKNTRYYYNLDVIRDKADSGSFVSDAEKLLLWSVNNYAYSNIKSLFANSFADNVIASGEYDMTGYSYYPIDAPDGTVVSANSRFVFRNNEIELGEIGTGNTDNMARSTSNASSKSQHHLMHFGLFRNVKGSLSVNGAKFSGSTGTTGSDGGVLICGVISGTNAQSQANVNIDGVILDGVTVSGFSASTAYAPLLINKVESFSQFILSDVSTTAEYTKDGVTAQTATSLIGNAGKTDGSSSNIMLVFSKLTLDGRKTALADSNVNTALNEAYNTKNSIFSKATLLDGFYFALGNGCSGAYNFALDEDWNEDGTAKHNVTYGAEISDSAEYDGLQEWYLQSDIYTDPTTNNNTSAEYSFSGFLPYVYAPYTTQSDNICHEIKINQLVKVDLADGCGTYNDPYIITSGKQLELVDKLLSGATLDSSYDGMVINYLSAANYKTWCTDKTSHKAYMWDSASLSFIADDSSTVTLADMQMALSTAYYQLGSNITVSSGEFQGLGTAFAFKGVIHGDNHTLENKTARPLIYQSTGAVVKDLTVHVSADFTGIFNKNNANSKYYTDGNGYAEFYGGLIGIVNGGDNIIDNVSVTFDFSSTISIRGGSNQGNKAIGGYIGVVRYGGVVFRNVDSSAKYAGITDNADFTVTAEDGYKNEIIALYCNPIIGRVIDGYAVTETDHYEPREENVTLKNGKKNYSIADIDKNSMNILAFSDLKGMADNRNWDVYVSTISVPDSQTLFLLSCIVASGGGKLDMTNNAYISDYKLTGYANSQMVRHGDYSDIGTNEASSADFDNKVSTFDKYSRDVAYSSGKFDTNKDSSASEVKEIVPYLIYRYTTASVTNTYKNAVCNYPARTLTSNGSIFNIELTSDSKMYDLPDGFRGIGSLNSNDDSFQMFIYSIKGNGSTVNLNMNFCKYNYDNYYSLNGWRDYKVGLGLFNALIQNRHNLLKKGTSISKLDTSLSDYTISDLTISGNVNTEVFESEKGGIKYDNKFSCAGGLAGGSYYASPNVKNVKLDNLTVGARHVSGGLIGSVYCTNDNKVVFENCGANNLTVGGSWFTGGLCGYTRNCQIDIIGEASGDNNTVFGISHLYSPSADSNNKNKMGPGGLIGSFESTRSITVKNMDITGGILENVKNSSAGGVITYTEGASTISLENVSVKNLDIVNSGTDISAIYSGGMLGYVSNASTVISMKDVSVVSDTASEINGSTNAGGIAGYITGTVTADGCYVSNYTVSSEGSNNGCGGLFGKTEAKMILKNSKVSDCVLKQGTTTQSTGALAGLLQRNYINGYNIVINNTKITDMSGNSLTNTTVAGDIIGKVNSGCQVNLVGVSMPKTADGEYIGKDFGTNSGSDYIIFCDYTGSSADENAANKTVPAINTDNDVSDIGVFPYATINPKKQIDSSAENPMFLTGNGADKAVIDKILSETDKEYGYTAVNSEYNDVFKAYEGKLSTFNTKTGANIPNDFPILVINESNYSNVTSMLNSYIRILTNNTDISNYAKTGTTHNVEISTYRLNEAGTAFVKLTDAASQTLCVKNDYFRMTDNDYDSKYNQFTLIDIQYYSPVEAGKTAYHLYIPVYVEKMLNFDFTAAALSGTVYNTGFYTNGNPVLESYGTPVTAHITYSYLRTVEEWQEAINSGENMLKGYGKAVVLSGDNDLPSGTKLVLLDRNNKDKAYYSTIADAFTLSDEKLDFAKFHTADSNTDYFSPVSFVELLSKSADITATQSDSGNLVKCGADDTGSATIKIGGDYYRKKTDTDTDTASFYTVTVTAKDGMIDGVTGNLIVKEDYYISFFTTADSSAAMRNITIGCSRRLGDSGMTPSHRNNVNANEGIVHMILGNLYDQTFTFETTGNEVINESNKSITAVLKTVVSLKAENAEEVKAYLNHDSINLYHSFIIEATRSDENGMEKGIKGNPQVSGTYKVGDDEYAKLFANTDPELRLPGTDMAEAVNIKHQLILNNSVTITCDDLVITYADEESIIAQFPERKTQEDDYGVNLSATSNLAYVWENIDSSNISAPISDSKIYYRDNIVAASLNYNVVSVSPDELIKLGINGNEANDEIQAVGYYNTLNIPEADVNKADRVKFTLSLYQKSVTGEMVYNSVNLPDYLKDVKLYDKNGTPKAYTVNGNSLEFVLSKDELNYEAGTFEVLTAYSVKTGVEFENENKIYANYRVRLSAELIDAEENSVSNSQCSDYIVYTNAKIYTKMITAE